MLKNKVAILVKKASLEFDKLSNPIFARYNLTGSQYRVLKYLYITESRTARVVDLEREFSMTHPTTLGLLSQLEKKGFTQRVDNPEDARGKLVALTPKAEEMEKELFQLGEEIEIKLTELLSEEEREELVILLRKLLGISEETRR